MSKKVWSLFSFLLIATMVLAACGGQQAATQAPVATEAPSQEKVTITIWNQWDDTYAENIKAAINKYTETHPNVTIDMTKPENVSDALKVAVPAGEGPDIIAWANDQIGSQALTGNIVALDDLGVDTAFLESNFTPPAVKGVVWQGKIWALPESVEGIAIVYNKAIASEADFPTDPKDFAGLLEKAKAYSEAHPGVVLFCNQALGNPDAYHAAPIYFGFGVPEYVDDQGKVYLNTPEAKAAGNWMNEVKAYLPKETSHEICKTMITEGKAAAWWTGPWAIADLEASGIDYGILPMGSPFVGVKTLMITKNAVDRGHAEIALDIMKYYLSAEVQKGLTLTNKTITANSAALADAEVQALATIAGFGASIQNGVPMANTPYANAQWGPVGDATTAIWTGTQPVDAALDAAQKAIEEGIAAMK